MASWFFRVVCSKEGILGLRAMATALVAGVNFLHKML